MIVVNKRGTKRNIADTQLAEYKRMGYEPVKEAVEKPAEPVMRDEPAMARNPRKNAER